MRKVRRSFRMLLRYLNKPLFIFSLLLFTLTSIFFFYKPYTSTYRGPYASDKYYSLHKRNFSPLSSKQTSGSSNILSSKKSVQYGIVVDCGSSGSRVFAYQWDRRHGVKDIKADHVYEAIDDKQPVIKKVEPGLSDQTPDEALDTVSELLTYVEPHIPEEAHADTIVYILATAGLRMIPFDQRQDILRTLRTKLPKMHKFDIQEVSVISGQEEALFAWLSINSIKGRLCSENTAAVLDMGGGSFQVAIPLNEEQLMAARENPEISSSDIQTVQLSCKKTHSVFIHTWLGYGANKARDRYETFLFPNATKTERVPDPCLNPGMQRGKFIGRDSKNVVNMFW